MVKLGFDPKLGARPLKRAVETYVVAPLARLLARSASRSPSVLTLSVRDGQIDVG